MGHSAAAGVGEEAGVGVAAGTGVGVAEGVGVAAGAGTGVGAGLGAMDAPPPQPAIATTTEPAACHAYFFNVIMIQIFSYLKLALLEHQSSNLPIF
jgi:hypothetical protein